MSNLGLIVFIAVILVLIAVFVPSGFGIIGSIASFLLWIIIVIAIIFLILWGLGYITSSGETQLKP